ncbi:MAG TPA: TIGR04454 family lipoprotein [Leptospiraceae bacterium]|nr:TIGR04454 family lipoprotein [Leptospiraceae bacterium]HMZ59588.1 TIGR04454 family lipoprotein [Leptospiraceae bacterium]HNF16940.1 TIGR04454 family lipoprotein [Leptospiraceae bacterium]HNF26132.1 TIGR04454 family lipoprotein [Leptospiraceae bacterium]HNM02314.1 TIGR04454 family lipoprotein [Leptospiraceae bacterium]
MRKTAYLLILLAALVANCGGGKSISPAECTPVVESMIENFKKMNPDKADEFDKQKLMILPALQKECESGKYKLDCLKNVKDYLALQSCKN